MTLSITKKTLLRWAGYGILRDAEALVENGSVLEAKYEPPYINGTLLWNNRPFNSSLRLIPDGTVENLCPCWTNKERGIVCSHVIALALTLARRTEAAAAPVRPAPPPTPAVDESTYLRRVPPDAPNAVPSRIEVSLPDTWFAGWRANSIALQTLIHANNRTFVPATAPRNIPFAFGKQDESLLFVLEDIAHGPVPASLPVTRADFLNILRLSTGRPLATVTGTALTVNVAPLTTHLRVNLDRQNGELQVSAHTEVPFARADDPAVYLVAGKSGWAFAAGNFWPLQNVFPPAFQRLYEETVTVPRRAVLSFIRQELPLLSSYARIESDLTPDLFSFEPAVPQFRLAVQGSPASLSAVLHAGYGDMELVAAKPDARDQFGIPDPNDLLRYTVRNLPEEKHALEALAATTGFKGEAGDQLTPIIGDREVLNFIAGQLPALRRRGWRVTLHGSVAGHVETMAFVTPVVHVSDVNAGSCFDVWFDFEEPTGTASISAADVHLALRKGESFVNANGRTVLIDADAVRSMMDVFSDCSTADGAGPGQFRLSNVYAPFVKTSMDALDGVDLEDTPAWRQMATTTALRSGSTEPLTLDPQLDGTLRPYQKDGVRWLRFLEANMFCGLLADEMGLGKTLQALAWLQLQRCDRRARGRPALVVCPTSLVDNWLEEAHRFVPAMKAMTLQGPDREEKWGRIPQTDLVITSYAILRRDVEQFAKCEFSAAILDEAQHIKNPSTQNAQAAKTLRAASRLVLTGTPMENSVSDLWSIMDFLMPGYMGQYRSFREHYELPIQRNRDDGDVARIKLRRKLQPFLLRRMKRDVAKELPPKIESIRYCQLSPDQAVAYKVLLESSQRKIADMVAAQGFNRSRMQILATLMRLRQVCCHLGLLKMEGVQPEQPSAKMDLFFELLDEALDSGHRVLVFSQFVSMLNILRDALNQRSLTCCYLVGSTKDRMDVVHRFNADRQIPVFLISLKAGGTGLNLTGADMVIHFDPWWNPAVENQATDRAYRIGQKKTVYSVKLITRGTVEEKVLALQERKKALIDATVTTDAQVLEKMSWDDIRELLTL